MVKHIVLWKLNDEGKKDGATKVVTLLQGKFKALLGVVDGLKAIEVGENYNGGEYDMTLYCEFESKEAQDNYQTHPAHLEIKKVVHTFVDGRACVDYVI
ncbi:MULTISPECIES: Dabb family protein [Clostridium]|uniref:Dabb family protein n=1 Tax=Clostridium cibarium TaxID=2762247 RepID=A0ABR8PT95_9CLOT|nr:MULTISPECIES: Dabb family protein [Clostridium]MBD7911384.1 Dabb family protein [Clostridium cibarium]